MDSRLRGTDGLGTAARFEIVSKPGPATRTGKLKGPGEGAGAFQFQNSNGVRKPMSAGIRRKRPENVHHFAQGCVGLHSVYERRHQVVVAPRSGFQGAQLFRHVAAVAGAAYFVDALDLQTFALSVYAEQRYVHLLAGVVLVYADGDALPAVFLHLVDVGGFCDFALQEASLQRRYHTADVFDAPEVIIAARLELVGHHFQEVAAAQRVHRVGDAGLVGNDLLGAEGLQGRFF